MKILTLMNISNEQDLACDSGYIFQRVLAKELTQRGCEYHVAGAKCPAFCEINNGFFEKHYISSGTNRYSSRYNFNFEEFAQLIQNVNPDVVFNCQIELTAAIKSVLETLKVNIPLIAYCHYPALWDKSLGKSNGPVIDQTLNNGHVGYNILFNVITSVITADAVVTQSNYARSLLEDAIKFYKIPYKNKIRVIAPPIDNELFCGFNIYKKSEHSQSFLYNHRLYKSYGSEEFIKFGRQMIKSCKLECMISDCMPNRSANRAVLNGSPEYFKSLLQKTKGFSVVNGNVARNTYRANILRNLFAVAAFRKSCVWSMAAIDCLCLGVPVIAPDYASYAEFIPKDLLFRNTSEAMEIVRRIQTDEDFRNNVSDKSFTLAKKFGADKTVSAFIKLFGREISKKCVA